jgi:multiple sugar transport system substrate-binding protein
MKIKRFLAALGAMTMMAVSFTACSKDGDSESSNEETTAQATESTENTESEAKGIEGQTICWMSDYDLNPYGGDARTIALTLFEDVYGGKIEWIPTTAATKYDDFANRILAGDPVDMFPYENTAIPDGVSKDLFEPLDDYINFDDELWTETKELADKMAYNGKHYVIPYNIENPACLIYSRKMMKDEKLDDPYELYKSGKWDYDTFLSMMQTFTENGSDRYGCTGWIGKSLVQSTGQPFVNYDGTAFSNNIMSPEIEKAETVLEKIGSDGLYNSSWQTYFPDDDSTLFYGMAPWALAESNAKNSDKDLFLVPFPKMTGSDSYGLCADVSAKMLAKNSDKAQAVATYITCERIAVTEEKYVEATKKKLLEGTTNQSGEKLCITQEQYDACQELVNTQFSSVVNDFGYGMGNRMSAETYSYDSRGVMLNLSDALLSEYEGSPSTWAELRDEWKAKIDEEILKFK